MKSIQSKAPQLRFPEFNGEWGHKSLGKVFTIFNGYAFSSGDACTTGVRWLKIADVGIQQMSMSGKSYLPASFTKKFPKFIVSKGDYVIALTRPILSGNLKIAKVDQVYHGALLNQRVGKLQTEESDTFVYYLLQNQRLIFDIENRIDGTDPPNFSPNEVNTINTFLPDGGEQDKIAIFLSTLDKKINLLKQKHEQLLQYKKGIMQQLFSQQLRFKDDDGQSFPDWEFRTGNKIFDVISDKKHNSDLPILAITQEHGAIPRDLINYQVQVTDTSVSGYKVVNKGDYIISLRSFQGGIEYSNYKGICSPAYIILRPSIEISDDFYRYYLKTNNFIQEMKKRLEGIRDGKILSYKYFSEISLPSPSVYEQKKIVDFLGAIDQKINLAQQQIEQTQAYKQGLLQQMFV